MERSWAEMVLKLRVVREEGKRDSVSMKDSSRVIGLEALMLDVAAAMAGGRGGWS